MRYRRGPTLFKDIWAWSFAIAVAGYPIAAVISTYRGYGEDNTVSLVFRALVIAACAISFFLSKNKTLPITLTMVAFPIIYFYGLLNEVAWDVFGASDLLIFALIICAVPAAFLSLGAAQMSERNTAWALFTVAGLATIGALWMQYSSPGEGLMEATGRLSFQKLNPITVGSTATIVIVTSYVLFPRVGRLPRVGVLAMSGLAIAALYMAASRGPLLSLAACVIAIPILRQSFKWVVALSVFAVAVILYLSVTDISWLLETLRFTGTGSFRSNQDRMAAIALGLELFWQNPFFGYGTQLPMSALYPHNLMVEVLMATGLVGVIPFLWMMVSVGKSTLLLSRRGHLLLPLLAVQFLTAAQFSGAIWGAGQMWIVFAVMTTIASSFPMRAKLRQFQH